ncbi:MAG: integrating conjugative element protein [Gammaproteobacteria bacterium]|uniref:integrating conjugative element protein n=1 Tax=uncultured Pseudacidovorax sp. TaxID=679313 RepID=UPI0025E293FE|nr:integrating conjugative element protein [uncultured Pseudacidovorax sp.]
MTTPSTLVFGLQRGLTAVVIGAVLVLHLPPAKAQPVTNSSLYYRLGGSSPTGGPINGKSTGLKLGFKVRLNYSCGKFDVGLSWANTMEGFKNLGTTISNAVKVGISSLPLYMLQRAQPGLYQLFQNFSQKADVLVAASLKTCEEMEAMIRNGQDPYEDYVKMAKGDVWKAKADASGDVVQAKLDINKNEEAQNRGVEWVFGTYAGGAGTMAIEPVRDLSIAGYNTLLNQAPAASSSTNWAASSSANTRLVRAFSSPDAMASWTTQVLGDKQVFLCSQTTCPQPTTTVTATGLGPRLEEELSTVRPVMQRVVADPGQVAQLKDISASGFAVSPQLVEAVRQLPAESRALATGRLVEELAMQRVIDKALVARSALIAGLSLPQATKATEMQRDVQAQVDRLTQYINDLMFEYRIRKEMTSETALAIMGEQFHKDSQAQRVPAATAVDPRPLENGRVRAN